MKKNVRDMVYSMYDGLCAYTGKPLGEDWQIDHVIPKSHPIWYQPEEVRIGWGVNYGCNDVGNSLPAIKIVNHYKRQLDIIGFRRSMTNFHERLKKLPKKTMLVRTEKRKAYMNKLAELFDITIDKPFCGSFYFETI